MAGAQQAEAVDLRVVDGANRDGQGAPADRAVQAVAMICGEKLRVVQAGKADADRQHDSTAHHRAGKRAHADLVHAGDDLVTHGAGHALVTPESWPHQPLTMDRDYRAWAANTRLFTELLLFVGLDVRGGRFRRRRN